MKRSLACVALSLAALGATAQEPPSAAPEARPQQEASALQAPASEAAPYLMPPDPQTGKYLCQGIVAVEGMSQADLFKAVKSWVAQTWKEPAAITKVDDGEGKLVLAPTMELSVTGPANTRKDPLYRELLRATVRFSLTVDVREGKYRFTATDFTVREDDFAKETFPERSLEYLSQVEMRRAYAERTHAEASERYKKGGSQPNVREYKRAQEVFEKDQQEIERDAKAPAEVSLRIQALMEALQRYISPHARRVE